MAQLGFYHNNNECIGCKVCVVACKDKNDLPVGEKYRRVYDYSGCTWNETAGNVFSPQNWFTYSVSVACMHCASPACQILCPVAAIKKRSDGVVWIDEDICIGCGTCVTACPYGEPYVSAMDGKAHKCDLCRSLIDNGKEPACVEACQMRCLEYGDLDELKAKYGDIQQVAPLSEDSFTGPSIVFTRSRLNPDGSIAGIVINQPEVIGTETVQ